VSVRAAEPATSPMTGTFVFERRRNSWLEPNPVPVSSIADVRKRIRGCPEWAACLPAD